MSALFLNLLLTSLVVGVMAGLLLLSLVPIFMEHT